MKLHDFKIGWRLLISQPAYSALIILGLSIGFASCFLLLSYAYFSFNYDRQIPEHDRIYQVMSRSNYMPNAAWTDGVPYPLIGIAQQNNVIEQVTAMSPKSFPLKVDNHIVDTVTLIAQPSFGPMFGVHVIAGDLAQTLGRPDHLALTISTAKKLFNSLNVIGKIVQINGQPYQVGALIDDPAQNSTLDYAALLGFDTPLWQTQHQLLKTYWSGTSTKIYVKLKQNATPESVTQSMQDAIDHSPVLAQMKPEEIEHLAKQKWMDIRLSVLPEVYFDENDSNSIQETSARGNRDVVVGLAALALMILLLAVTNYVNLATVRTIARQREIAMRKVMGASLFRLIAQFLSESVLAALIATVIGLAIAGAILPSFSALVDRNLVNAFSPETILCSLVFGLVVGLLAGIYPAWIAIRMRPSEAQSGRGSTETQGGLWFRRMLSVLQLSVAIGLTGVTLAIAWQTRFASLAPPGFDPNSLLVLDLPAPLTDPASMGLRDSLSRLPGVTGVITSADPIGRSFDGGTSDLIRSNGLRSGVVWRPVSPNFFEVLSIHPIAGRLFDSKIDRENTDIKDANMIVINQAAARALGFTSPEQAVGQVITTATYTVEDPRMESMTIVGVAPDIRHQTLRESPRPLVYSTFVMTSVLTVKSAGNLTELEGQANKLVQQYFPNNIVPIKRESAYLAESYKADLQVAKLLGIASVIALLIAAFGIFVLSTYNLQRMSKQIVLRKLYGAKHSDIAIFVGREFIALIAISAAIGLPIAALAIQRYLSAYVEQAPIGEWTLFAALAVALLATFASTFHHTVAAMGIAPARILRD